MKFGNLLRERVGDLPEYDTLFQCYKQLKKKLKGLQRPAGLEAEGDGETDISSSDCGSALCGVGSVSEGLVSRASSDSAGTRPCLSNLDTSAAFPTPTGSAANSVLGGEFAHFTSQEANFLHVLSLNLEQFNQTFLETEECCVIRMRELTDSWDQSSDLDSMKGVYRRFIDLHGEILLLMNWSMLAYTSIVKILKKHEKHTGQKLIAPHMEDLLHQPFCSTEATTALAKKAKLQIEELTAAIEERSSSAKAEDAGTPDSHTPEQTNCMRPEVLPSPPLPVYRVPKPEPPTPVPFSVLFPHLLRSGWFPNGGIC
mmetsp:Transcript_37308/g.105262  ORF Transcript_37308/g.105262 Transcript_37308/m.105262 type:complete len:313 (+) Transcript_37308:529-1467(+)